MPMHRGPFTGWVERSDRPLDAAPGVQLPLGGDEHSELGLEVRVRREADFHSDQPGSIGVSGSLPHSAHDP